MSGPVSAQSENPLTQLARDLRADRFLPGIVTGLLIGTLNVMIAISFAALIFSGKLAANLPTGIGMVLIGDWLVCSLVALIGSHPSMVAISQDVPVAILAPVIAGALAAMPPEVGVEQQLFTALLFIAGTTLLTGLCFLVLGSFKLGGLVRFLPYPVIGGFLAGTGWLLFVGGIGIMVEERSIAALVHIDSLVHWLPGVVLALVLMFVSRRVDHPLTIPGVVAVAISLFYLLAWVSTASLPGLSAQGWLLGKFPAGSLWRFPLDPAILRMANWGTLVSNVQNVLPILLISVVTLLLNVSGMELIVKQDINLNRELVVAGVANLVGGMFGAIVSFQSVSFSALNHKMSDSSRFTALVCAAVCLVSVLLGPLALTYVPKFILGGMLAFLGLTLLEEWVIQSRRRFPPLEYFVVLLILAVAAIFGFLQGVVVGLLAAVTLFIINYSRIDVVKHVLTGASFQSRVSRLGRHRAVLLAQSDQIYIMQLQGYLFFGTAYHLLQQVRQRLAHDDKPQVRSLVLDFQHVTGLDSTAILSFMKMKQIAQERHLNLIFSALSPAVEGLFANNVLGEMDDVKIFSDLDRAVEWCEEEILPAEAAGEEGGSLLDQLALVLPEAGNLKTVLGYLDRQEFSPGEYLMRQGDDPDVMYFIEQGQVTAQLETGPGTSPARLETMHGGRVVGEIGFYLGLARTATVRADEPTTVFRLSLEKLREMEKTDPASAATIHRLIAHFLAERAAHLIRAVDALLQ
jgi:SulP family sulfate permease